MVISKKVCFYIYNYPAVKKRAKELNWSVTKLINFCILDYMYGF